MKNENYVYDAGHIALIRQRLRAIQDALFDGGDALRKQLEKPVLFEEMSYLEKENDRLPLYFTKQIDFVLSEVRYILSHELKL
jgi:hypothetical protein